MLYNFREIELIPKVQLSTQGYHDDTAVRTEVLLYIYICSTVLTVCTVYLLLNSIYVCSCTYKYVVHKLPSYIYACRASVALVQFICSTEY